MTVHNFTPTHYHTTIGSHPPVLRIANGDTVVTPTVDARGWGSCRCRGRRRRWRDATPTCASLPSGSVADGTVWTVENSPYMVNCDLRVANTASSLTIQAGVEVLFATGKRMRVEGPLTVDGSALDSVVFGSQQANPQRGDWRGIEIVEQKSSQKGDFSTVVRVDLHTDRQVHTAAGTLFSSN